MYNGYAYQTLKYIKVFFILFFPCDITAFALFHSGNNRKIERLDFRFKGKYSMKFEVQIKSSHIRKNSSNIHLNQVLNVP